MTANRLVLNERNGSKEPECHLDYNNPHIIICTPIILHCKGKRQYLPTHKVNSHCLLALSGSIRVYSAGNSVPFILANFCMINLL